MLESQLKKNYFIEGESEMTLILETADNADVYIMKGSDRETAEVMIENGDRLYPGNPLRISDMSDVLILFRRRTIDATTPGSFTLSYELSGP